MAHSKAPTKLDTAVAVANQNPRSIGGGESATWDSR